MKLLVVDDEPEICRMIKGMLEPLGIEALALSSSQEAARRVATEKFDGILLDANMPPPNGFDLCKIVRTNQLNREAPIVMITGSDDAETMRRGFREGITFFLGKPFTREKLYGLIRVARGLFLKEKRRHVRLPYRTTVICKSRGQEERVTSLNLGEGGMALQSAGGAPVNETLELEFRLPNSDDPVKVRAKVIRKEPPDRTAVQFLDLAERDQRAIREYIAGKVRD